jgi:hypothetical protein
MPVTSTVVHCMPNQSVHPRKRGLWNVENTSLIGLGAIKHRVVATRARLLCAGLLHFNDGARNVHTPQHAAVQSPGIRVLARARTEIHKLVVDVTYQREIGRRGASNVNQIAENFDWSKFAPVIVAPVEGGQFANVDGQHRTTAAMLRGQEKVPCQVVQADRAKQAAAYAAVSGNITKTTAQQLCHAKLAAKDAYALALAEVCAAADVEILRKNLIRSDIKKGQTHAVTALGRCLTLYGRDTLITALQCITQTADGNAGFVRATIIEALCESSTTLRNGERRASSFSAPWTSSNLPTHGIRSRLVEIRYSRQQQAKRWPTGSGNSSLADWGPACSRKQPEANPEAGGAFRLRLSCSHNDEYGGQRRAPASSASSVAFD